MKTKKKRKVKNWLEYQDVFDLLMIVGENLNLVIPIRILIRILKRIDEVADYFGDVAMGRIKPKKS